MKNLCILLFLLVVLGATSCAVNSDEKLNGNAEISTTKQLSPSPKTGIIPDTVLYYELVLKTEDHSWQDLDYYYKVTLPKYHSDKPYTQNLKKATIYGLISPGKFLEKADKPTIEWYTQELLSMSLPDPDALIQCLSALDGYWPKSQLKQRASSAYDKLITDVQKHTKYPEEVMARNEASYNRLKDFASNISAN